MRVVFKRKSQHLVSGILHLWLVKKRKYKRKEKKKEKKKEEKKKRKKKRKKRKKYISCDTICFCF